MIGSQTLDLLNAAWRQDMDPEALPMTAYPLQDEFDEATFHQLSNRSRHVLALDSNAIG
jgi:hypothetical protein